MSGSSKSSHSADGRANRTAAINSRASVSNPLRPEEMAKRNIKHPKHRKHRKQDSPRRAQRARRKDRRVSTGCQKSVRLTLFILSKLCLCFSLSFSHVPSAPSAVNPKSNLLLLGRAGAVAPVWRWVAGHHDALVVPAHIRSHVAGCVAERQSAATAVARVRLRAVQEQVGVNRRFAGLEFHIDRC